MAAPVPAVDRVKLVLDLLASDPQRRYRAAEVARSTAVHRASCFVLLSALTDAGFVTRHADGPTYSLGPQLIAYGVQAAASFGPMTERRRAMFRLADEFDCGAILTARADYEMLTLDSVGIDDELRPGSREPLRAPRGTIFLAWSPRSELDEWIAWSSVSEPEQRAVVRTAAAIHARGYSLGADVELGMSLERLARQLSDRADPRNVDDVLQDLAKYLHRSTHASGTESAAVDDAVHRISAPIFDHLGRVEMTLTLVADTAPFDESSLGVVTGALVKVTNRLSAGRTSS